jgi:ABC-type lipoprotein export system ATPase subunit
VSPETLRDPGNLLWVDDINVTFRSPGQDAIVVLNGFSAHVAARELIVAAGRSGSGKTTLLNVAAGLLQPSHGSVHWAGTNIGGLRRDEVARRRAGFIGYVFQNAGLIDSLTAAENVALPGLPDGAPLSRTRALELLEAFGVARRSGHFPAQLSGGEQQRVAIARALYTDPPLLIVDEPTANVDRQTADEIVEELVRLRDRGRGLLVASHDPHLIGAADRVVQIEIDSAPSNRARYGTDDSLSSSKQTSLT